MERASRAKQTYTVNQQVTAEVERPLPYGAFVRLVDGTPAYIRRRELSLEGDLDPRQVISRGEAIRAVIVALPQPGRTMELSVRRLQPDPWAQFERQYKERDDVVGTVKSVSSRGAFIQLIPGVDGFVPLHEMAVWRVEEPGEMLWAGDQTQAVITRVNRQARKVRLSIRRRMEQQLRAVEFAHHLDSLREEESDEAWEDEGAYPDEVEESTESLRPLGRVLVVDDDKAVLDPLAEWLRLRGCEAEGATSPARALARLRDTRFDLVLADIDLAGEDGVELICQIRRASPGCLVAVISAPERIVERGKELEEQGVEQVFAKPLDLAEIEEGLARIARGEPSGGYDLTIPGPVQNEACDSFRALSREMRSNVSVRGRFEAGLRELLALTRAEAAIVFHRDPISHRVSIVAQIGVLPLNDSAVSLLEDSPVKDLICEDQEIFEPHVSCSARARFSKLRDLLPFESCIGVPIRAEEETHYALFLFHQEPDAFSHYRLRDAWAMATLFGVVLEDGLLERRAQDMGRFLLSGELAAGFGHEVYNKISGLEIQLRNLGTEYRKLSCPEGAKLLADSSAFAEIGDAINAVLDVALDLKRVAVSFRELTRTEVQEEIDVNEAIRRAKVLLRPTARRYKVRIATKLSPDLPTTLGSAARLQQAFSNVMLNAIQQVAGKMERLSDGWGALEVVSSWDPQDVLCPIKVRFADTGPGIHRRLWDSIFVLGFSTRPGGSGLGLFIARSITESMGGRIAVERSTIPFETTFLVELPCCGFQGHDHLADGGPGWSDH